MSHMVLYHWTLFTMLEGAELVGVKIYVASKIYIAICHTYDSIFTDDSSLGLGDILSFL